MIKKETVDRINVLAKKAKSQGLTDEEKIEQQALRKEYLAAFRENLKKQLDQIEFVEDVEKSQGIDEEHHIIEIEENLN